MPKINNHIGYRKTYRLRNAIPNKKSIEVTFPYEVVERAAAIAGITVQEFIRNHIVIAEYNGFDGVIYKFKEIDNNGS